MVLFNHKILKTIILRRTKKGRAVDLGLPLKIVTLLKDCFDVKEEDYYRSLWDESRAQFYTYIQDGMLMNNYVNIFNLLTRMRQVNSCTHVFCKSCLINFTAIVGQLSCPSCFESITVDFTANDQKTKASIKGFRTSSILNIICVDNFSDKHKNRSFGKQLLFNI
uniref:Zinc finger C3HC4 RING-type domain-containing protein n=1 Tax=Solanum lycopersicum TaxID=4081 RepID=A0A3Q7HDK1_SOLLC